MDTSPPTTSDPSAAPVPAAAPARRRGWPGRLLGSFSAYLLGVVAVVGLLAGVAWWLLYTQSGATWALGRVAGLQASGVSGSLLGGLMAEQLELTLPGETGRLRLQALRWSAPRLRAAGGPLWLRVEIDELRALRADLWLSDEPSADSDPPVSLELPLGLDVAALRIDALHVDGIDTPLQDLRARIALATDHGRSHRIDALQLQWDRLRMAGQAQVATTGALQTQAELQLTQPPGAAGDWSATLKLQGPLAQPELQARLRAQATPASAPQTLDASAELRPFAAWPLRQLQAQAVGLDLGALHSAAPRTALDLEASAHTDGMDRPAAVQIDLANRDAGRWNEGRLPLRRLQLDLQAQPDDPTRLDVRRFDAELGNARAAAGRVGGSGHWNPSDWRFDTRLSAFQPAQLDARAPQMRLDGRLQVVGTGFGNAPTGRPQLQLRGNLEGQLLDRGPAQPVQLRLDAGLSELRIELRELLAQAGGAQASLNGRLTRASPRADWAAVGQASLREFDPLPWWPGRLDSPWRRGPHRVNASGDFDLQLPSSRDASAWQQLARVRGRADLKLEPSKLAGVPLSGGLALHTAADGSTLSRLQLQSEDNRVLAEGRLDLAGQGKGDHWQLKADLPALKRLEPLWQLLDVAGPRLAGKFKAEARVDGRWPALTTSGQLQADALQLGTLQVERADGRWKLGSRGDAPLDLLLELKQVRQGAPSAERIELKLQGTPAAHALRLAAESKSLPPAWVEALQAGPANAAAQRTLARLELQGGVPGPTVDGWKGWQGKLKAAELRGDVTAAPPWLKVGEFGFDLQWADGPLRLKADAGQAELLGAVLRWSRVAWSAADDKTAARLDAEASLEPLDVAPLLARAQPGFGWGGDLRLGGRVVLQSAPTFTADVVLERSSGDLSVTDEAGTRTLGLSDLRVGLDARGGVWSFYGGLAGKTLGSATGALVARTSATAIWPLADAPLYGVFDLRIADLGVWGSWVPPGWRLSGTMQASAAIEGRFGAPEFTGELNGQGLGVRNVLQGVEVRDGELRIVLQGDRAQIEKFAASAGEGRLSLVGDANLGPSPRADLGLTLERFQLLGRIDRRIVASGDAMLKLGRDTLALDGAFRIDEGLIDFSRSDAPRLSDDVHVHRGIGDPGAFQPTVGDATEAERRLGRRASIDLRVDMGEKLRVRGRGLDAELRGQLRLTAPQGRLRVDGNLRTVNGTYRAYRQRLDIERGVLVFNGPIENPQLDIEAIRPNLDVRVGVAVTGTVLVPRVRLFSDTEMSDAERLSWLLRGRPSDGPGSGDAALLQAAAMALVAGEESNGLDQLIGMFGLDELSIRQAEGGTGGAIVSVGKQLSRRWYVGYERGINATTGNWQLIYRVAQRFTVRTQSGENNSIELIWSWRWN